MHKWFPMVSKWCRISSIHSITRWEEVSSAHRVRFLKEAFKPPGLLLASRGKTGTLEKTCRFQRQGPAPSCFFCSGRRRCDSQKGGPCNYSILFPRKYSTVLPLTIPSSSYKRGFHNYSSQQKLCDRTKGPRSTLLGSISFQGNDGRWCQDVSVDPRKGTYTSVSTSSSDRLAGASRE